MSVAVKTDRIVCTTTPPRKISVVAVSPALASAAKVTLKSTPLLESPSSVGESATLMAFGGALSTLTLMTLPVTWLPDASVAVARKL